MVIARNKKWLTKAGGKLVGDESGALDILPETSYDGESLQAKVAEHPEGVSLPAML